MKTTTRLFNEYSVRGTDRRPDEPIIQINVINPADPGHSMCFFVRCDDSTAADVDDVMAGLEASGEMATMINKAHKAFFEI